MKAKNLIGKLVVVSHWSDFDYPADAVRLGRLRDIRDGYFYIDNLSRGYRYCRKVSRQNIKLEKE